jgi:hypothetical protein
VTRIDRAADVREVEERRRVDRDQVDVGARAERGYRGVVARRHHVHYHATSGTSGPAFIDEISVLTELARKG